MTSVERVKKICKERRIPIYRIEKDLGFANGYIGQLRKGTFPNDRLALIAQYLNVTIEELMDDDTRAILTTSSSDASAPQLENVYLSFAKEAQDAGIDPEDIKNALELIKKIRAEG